MKFVHVIIERYVQTTEPTDLLYEYKWANFGIESLGFFFFLVIVPQLRLYVCPGLLN